MATSIHLNMNNENNKDNKTILGIGIAFLAVVGTAVVSILREVNDDERNKRNDPNMVRHVREYHENGNKKKSERYYER